MTKSIYQIYSRYLINLRFYKNSFETRFCHFSMFYEKIGFRLNDHFWTCFLRHIHCMDILTLVGVQCHLRWGLRRCIGFFVLTLVGAWCRTFSGKSVDLVLPEVTVLWDGELLHLRWIASKPAQGLPKYTFPDAMSGTRTVIKDCWWHRFMIWLIFY